MSSYSRLRLGSQKYHGSFSVSHLPYSHGVSTKFISDQQSTEFSQENAPDMLQMTENVLARISMSLATMNYNEGSNFIL